MYHFILLPINESDSEKAKILWLIRLRWLFLFFQFAFIIPYLVTSSNPIKKLVQYIGLCFILVVFNSILFGVWKKVNKPISQFLTWFCLIVDLTWFSVLFWFLAIDRSLPFESIYFIHAIIGAILLQDKKGFGFYILIAVNLLTIQFGKYVYLRQELDVFNIVFYQFILLSVWIITRSVNQHVTTQKEKINQLKLYAEKMDRLRALGALTAGFSHEFSSPLNTIKLRLDRISRSEKIKREDLDSAELAIQSCENIIKKMNLSQFDRRDDVFFKLNIQNSLKELIENWKVDHPNVNIEWKVDSSVPKELKLPIVNLSQGIINVLDNAVDSSPMGSEIVVDLYVHQNQLIISIKDNGSGFSKEILNRFGEPFVTTKKTGKGLGLYTFQLFAQSLGGFIRLSNLKPNGACVEFVAPMQALSETS